MEALPRSIGHYPGIHAMIEALCRFPINQTSPPPTLYEEALGTRKGCGTSPAIDFFFVFP
jgi:hypothetical protein